MAMIAARTAPPSHSDQEGPEDESLERLIPDELPDFPPSHPDDFANEVERKGNENLQT
jgi:hypothetical protein